MCSDKRIDWWEERYGFFGEFYMEGDNSYEGYLDACKMNIEQRTKEDVDGVVRLLDLKQWQHTLDVPCGYGRHSIELAKRGYSVVGVDINSVHLNVARRRAAKVNTPSLRFRKGNMLELSYNKEFDAVINMCYSFGFFETDEQNMQVLKNFYRALIAGGKFLMETDVNLARVRSGKYKTDEVRHLRSGKKLQIIDRYNTDTRRMDGAWIIHKADGTQERKDYSVRVYEVDEFIQMCLDVGFKTCKAYSDWYGNPYHQDSELIIFVATK